MPARKCFNEVTSLCQARGRPCAVGPFSALRAARFSSGSLVFSYPDWLFDVNSSSQLSTTFETTSSVTKMPRCPGD
jgi:hypothetical protein